MIEPLIPGWLWAIIALVALIAAIALGLYILTHIVSGRVTKGMPPEGRFVEVNGHRLHYVDSADAAPEDRDKPAVLLIHGLGGQLRNFTHTLDAKLRDGFRVVALDRPGAGQSERRQGSDQTLPAQAADVVGFMQAIGLQRPLLVGHSLGGAISLAVGLDHPDQVAGLVLVAPLTMAIDEPPPVFKPIMIESEWRRRATAWTLATPMGIRNGPAGLAAVFHPETPSPDFGTRGGGLIGLRPQNFLNTSRDLVALRDALPRQQARYGDLTIPVALIHGTDDAITPYETQALAFAHRTGARLETIEGAGHMLPVTRADDVARFVAECAREWAGHTGTGEKTA